jgi:hypothetical protein
MELPPAWLGRGALAGCRGWGGSLVRDAGVGAGFGATTGAAGRGAGFGATTGTGRGVGDDPPPGSAAALPATTESAVALTRLENMRRKVMTSPCLGLIDAICRWRAEVM